MQRPREMGVGLVQVYIGKPGVLAYISTTYGLRPPSDLTTTDIGES